MEEITTFQLSLLYILGWFLNRARNFKRLKRPNDNHVNYINSPEEYWYKYVSSQNIMDSIMDSHNNGQFQIKKNYAQSFQ